MSLKLFSRTLAKTALIAGTCIVMAGSVSQAFADCTPGNCYGAIAAATWNDSSGSAYVATGIAWNYDSENGAEQAAISQCQSRGGGQYCVEVGTFSNGACGYVTTGTNATGVRWGIGATPDDALNACQMGGFTCDPPGGGCTAGAQ